MSNSSPKFCPSCGHKLQPNAKFCPECGEKMAAPAAEASPTVEPAAAAAPAAEPAAAAAVSAAPAEAAAPVAQPKAAAEPSKAAVSSLLYGDDDDGSVSDSLPDPEEAETPDDDAQGPVRKALPVGLIAAGAVAAVVLGAALYTFADDARSAAFACNVLGQKDKCETEAMKLAKLNRQKFEEEQQLMVSAVAEFGLSYDPKDAWVTIVQKRYEETRDEFVARVKGDGPDNRKLAETRYGDYQIGKGGKGADNQIRGAIAFVTEEEWKAKHSSPDTQPSLIPEPPPPPPKPGEAAPATPPPPPAPPPVLPTGPISYWPRKNQEVTLPLNVQNIPMLEKEQVDGAGKRLTAEAIVELQKKIEDAAMAAKANAGKEGEEGKTPEDPAAGVKTVAVSTWVYEVHLWAPGYFKRDVLFYDDPLPAELDKKKLEADKWTLRKFKRLPDGKLIIDNASFDLLPEPRTLRTKYLRVLREIHCMQQSKEYAGKSDQGKKDAEDLIWEQLAFTKEKREIALKNDGDAEFEKMKAEEIKNAKCTKDAE